MAVRSRLAELLRVISLRNLSTEAVRALLGVERVPDAVLGQVMALTHGHPLAVSLLIDVIRRSGRGTDVPGALADLPDLVSAVFTGWSIMLRVPSTVPRYRYPARPGNDGTGASGGTACL